MVTDNFTATDRYGAGVDPAGWRPIETAPRDGTDVLLYWPTRELGLSDAFASRMIGYWSNSQAAWVWQGRAARSYSFDPTLWQPLPPPPPPPEAPMSETRAAIVWTISHATEKGEQWRTMVAAKDPAEALRLVTQLHPWVVPGAWKIECEPLIVSQAEGGPHP